jgi:hypothetical protein
MIGSDALPLSIMETDRRPSMSSIRRSNNIEQRVHRYSRDRIQLARHAIGTLRDAAHIEATAVHSVLPKGFLTNRA